MATQNLCSSLLLAKAKPEVVTIKFVGLFDTVSPLFAIKSKLE